MKVYVRVISLVILISGAMVLSDFPSGGPSDAGACACSYTSGNPGGGDFVPQRRDAPDSFFNRPALTREQAHDVVVSYIKKWNPDLEIGEIKDAGSFYEAEILSGKKELLGLLAVDKQSGRLMIIK